MQRLSNLHRKVRGYLWGAGLPPFLFVVGTLSVLAEEPFRPTNETLILAKGLSKEDRSIKALKSASAASPREIENRARHSLERYRGLGSAADLARARVAVEEILRIDPESGVGRLLKARLLQFDHHFDPSVDLLNQVIASNRDLRSEAQLVKAGILTVQGKFEEARKACATLLFAGDELLSYTCAAWPLGMTSDPSPLIDEIERHLDANPKRRADEIGRWAIGIQADMLDRIGKRAEAQNLLREISSPSAPELAQLADLLLSEGRNDEVVKLLSDRTNFDTLLLRLVVAQHRLGMKTDETLDRDLEMRMRSRERIEGGDGHARELALYFLEVEKDPQRAWQLARRGLEFQKEAIDFRIALRTARATRSPDAEKEVRRLAEVAQYFDVEFRQ